MKIIFVLLFVSFATSNIWNDFISKGSSNFQCVQNVVQSLPNHQIINSYVTQFNQSFISNQIIYQIQQFGLDFGYLVTKIRNFDVDFQRFQEIVNEFNDSVTTLSTLFLELPLKVDLLSLKNSVDKQELLQAYQDVLDISSVVRLMSNDFVGNFSNDLQDLSKVSANVVVLKVLVFEIVMSKIMNVNYQNLNLTLSRIYQLKNVDIQNVLMLIKSIEEKMKNFGEIREKFLGLKSDFFEIVDVFEHFFANGSEVLMKYIPSVLPLVAELQKIDVTVKMMKCISNITQMIDDFNKTILLQDFQIKSAIKNKLVEVKMQALQYIQRIMFENPQISQIIAAITQNTNQIRSKVDSNQQNLLNQFTQETSVNFGEFDEINFIEQETNLDDIKEELGFFQEINETLNNFEEMRDFYLIIERIRGLSLELDTLNFPGVVGGFKIGLRAYGDQVCVRICQLQSIADTIKEKLMEIKSTTDIIPAEKFVVFFRTFNSTFINVHSHVLRIMQSLSSLFNGTPISPTILQMILKVKEKIIENDRLPYDFVDKFEKQNYDIDLNFDPVVELIERASEKISNLLNCPLQEAVEDLWNSEVLCRVNNDENEEICSGSGSCKNGTCLCDNGLDPEEWCSKCMNGTDYDVNDCSKCKNGTNFDVNDCSSCNGENRDVNKNCVCKEGYYSNEITGVNCFKPTDTSFYLDSNDSLQNVVVKNVFLFLLLLLLTFCK